MHFPFSIYSRQRDRRGSTLSELITAIFMLSLALVSALAFTTINFKNEAVGASRLVASNLAREGVELARNIRDTNWIKGDPFAKNLNEGTNKLCVIIPPTLDRFSSQACGEHLMGDEPFRIYQDLQKGTYVQASVSATDKGTGFYRTITMMPICTKNDTNSIPTDTPSEQCSFDEITGLQVVSDVHWIQSGIEYNVLMTEQLYNWR